MTGLIPLYLKTTYKNDPLFQNSKSVFTVYNNKFNHKFNSNLADKAKMLDIEDSMLANLKSADYDGFIKTGVEFADVVIKSKDDIADLDNLLNGMNVDTIKNDEESSESYYKLYNQLVE